MRSPGYWMTGIDRGASVGAYCGSGVSATVTVAALAALGREQRFFRVHGLSGVRIRTAPLGAGPNSRQMPGQLCRKAAVAKAALPAASCL